MNNWNKIENSKDIEDLLETFNGFHDSCVVSFRYESGNFVDEDGNMVFATNEQYELHIIFESQWEPKTVELCFNGVRQLHLVGLADNYTNDIYSAYIAFHDGLLPSKYSAPNRVIVWAADCANVKEISSSLEEPSTTYVISNSLKWRVVNEG